MVRSLVRCTAFCSAGLLAAFILFACFATLARLSAPSVVVVPEFHSAPAVITADTYNGFESTWLDTSPRFVIMPGVLLLVGMAVLCLTVRRRHVADDPSAACMQSDSDDFDAAEIEKRRREAEVIRRMYGVMDRIETRVERLESSLLQ